MDNARMIELKDAVVEKMQEVAFSDALVACNRIEQMHALLNENGINITVDEVAEFTAAGGEALKRMDAGELSAEDLDDVAGGGWFRKTVRFGIVAVGAAGVGFVCGVCPALTPIAYPYAIAGAYWVSRG